jgi:hypothetical protein
MPLYFRPTTSAVFVNARRRPNRWVIFKRERATSHTAYIILTVIVVTARLLVKKVCRRGPSWTDEGGARQPRLICVHGRQHYYCAQCGGAGMCERGRQRRFCEHSGAPWGPTPPVSTLLRTVVSTCSTPSSPLWPSLRRRACRYLCKPCRTVGGLTRPALPPSESPKVAHFDLKWNHPLRPGDVRPPAPWRLGGPSCTLRRRRGAVRVVFAPTASAEAPPRCQFPVHASELHKSRGTIAICNAPQYSVAQLQSNPTSFLRSGQPPLHCAGGDGAACVQGGSSPPTRVSAARLPQRLQELTHCNATHAPSVVRAARGRAGGVLPAAGGAAGGGGVRGGRESGRRQACTSG